MEEIIRAFIMSLIPFFEEEEEEQKTIAWGVVFVLFILAAIFAALYLSD